MPNRAEARIYRLFAICIFIATVAFIVPQFVSNPEGAFASGSSAIATLLIMLGAPLIFSLYLLGVTVQQFRNLSNMARLAGIGTSVVLATILFGLLGFLRY